MVNIIMISIFYLWKAYRIKINPFKVKYYLINNSKLNYIFRNLKYNKNVYSKFIHHKVSLKSKVINKFLIKMNIWTILKSIVQIRIK